MVTRSDTFFVSAFAEGLFLAILTRTGQDISPSGLGLTIFKFLEPIATEKSVWIFRFSEVVLYILPWIGLVPIYQNYGKKGILAYLAIIAGSYVFILYFWRV